MRILESGSKIITCPFPDCGKHFTAHASDELCHIRTHFPDDGYVLTLGYHFLTVSIPEHDYTVRG